MIKFFRKIRQQLLTSRQMKKYSLYAIGEIFLVVIGILIALQINNWNNNRKDLNLTDTYLIRLKEDAKKDIQDLNKYIRRSDAYIHKMDSISISKEENLTMKDLDEIGILRQTYFLKDETYQEIIANGHLKLLPKNVKNALMNLNSRFKAINKIDHHTTTIINTQHLKMADYFEIKRLKQPGEYKMTLDKSSNKEKALLVYKNYINVTYDAMKTQLYFYSQLKKRHLDLIRLVEEEK